VLLLILAVIWAGVVASLVRDRVGERPSDSIGSFRRQLHVLQRTAPATVTPANTLYAPREHQVAPISAMPMRRRPGAVAAPATPADSRRARTMKRRKDVLIGLLGAMAVTLLLGLVPSFRILLGLHVVLDLAFAGYVALLVRMRNTAAEAEMKLRFLPGAPGAPEPALLLRRSAN